MIHKAWANINNWYTSLLHDMRFATTASATKGFTIVELLIVIVVIGILAAIIIVAYIGVTNKANQAAAKGNAEGVQKVAEAYNADNGSYASMANLNSYNGSSKLPSGVSLISATALTASNKDGKTIVYLPNAGGTGACIGYWDATTSAAVFVYAGAATAGVNAAPDTCS